MPAALPRIVSLTVTCPACPWQAEGQFADGRWFYFRHRFCSAQLGIGSTIDEAVDDTFRPITQMTWHEDGAAECPGKGYCSGLEGEEISAVFWKLWQQREQELVDA